MKELNENFEDGSYIVYVNGSYTGDDEMGRLMQDFRCTDAEDIQNPELAEGVKHFRESEGRIDMRYTLEQYAQDFAEYMVNQTKMQTAIQTAIRTSLEFGADKPKIITILCKDYSLTEKEAEDAYREYNA